MVTVALYYTGVGLEKNVTYRQRTDREPTENRETNYRGHFITVPMERQVERANIVKNGTAYYAIVLHCKVLTLAHST